MIFVIPIALLIVALIVAVVTFFLTVAYMVRQFPKIAARMTPEQARDFNLKVQAVKDSE